ncbi:MAG: transcription elongation protein SprT [Bacteroidetes bacterium]|nr:transcription elongation protein SprT [Bacteroidota bacterium]
MKITRSRSSKLGDYRYLISEKKHLITINFDLNPYQFMITYIHEVAHLITFEKFQTRVKPHGKEWRENFQNLIQPLIRNHVFPEDLLPVIKLHFNSPKASTCADPKLIKALSRYDRGSDATKMLSDIDIGEVFSFNKRLFQKEQKKRTRSVCLDLKTGKKFLISEIAKVEVQNKD